MSAILFGSNIVHYEVLGRGRPMIFLHSWVGSWRYWIPAMQSASGSCRTYALDLWGFGDTAKAKPEYALERQAALINDFMEHMGIGRIALVGHGIGAWVALLFANKYPAVVDRMMLIACPLEGEALNNRLKTSSQNELADWLLGKTAAADTEAVRTDALKNDAAAARSSVEEMSQWNFNEMWKNIAKPTLFVYGQNDPMVSTLKFEELPPMAHEIIFDQSGHFPMLDENSKFNRLLTDFTSLVSGVSPQQLQVKEEWKRRVR